LINYIRSLPIFVVNSQQSKNTPIILSAQLAQHNKVRTKCIFSNRTFKYKCSSA
jgi:hypothetical protein